MSNAQFTAVHEREHHFFSKGILLIDERLQISNLV